MHAANAEHVRTTLRHAHALRVPVLPDLGQGMNDTIAVRVESFEVATRPLVRYVPPAQIVRIRIAPGTRTRTELRQTVTERFDTKCMGGTLERFSGEAWADTTNASGLDATSKHIHFASR